MSVQVDPRVCGTITDYQGNFCVSLDKEILADEGIITRVDGEYELVETPTHVFKPYQPADQCFEVFLPGDGAVEGADPRLKGRLRPIGGSFNVTLGRGILLGEGLLERGADGLRLANDNVQVPKPYFPDERKFEIRLAGRG